MTQTSDPDATLRSSPFAPSAIRAARTFAELALEHASRRDPDATRAAIENALLLLDAADEPVGASRVGLLLGEALLAMNEPARAKERFEPAARVFEAAGAQLAFARALHGLARALRMLGDPTARAVLEEAGLAYEESGEHGRAHAIDRELRALEASIEESPRSFSSVRRIAVLGA